MLVHLRTREHGASIREKKDIQRRAMTTARALVHSLGSGRTSWRAA
jgi:hypothetical protein